jgi:DNA-binding MarR family transcriptional regulator/GNAT superfamily N-acetyltransferase
MRIPPEQVEQLRAFNRDYTRRIGVLSRGLLDSRYSLTQVRVMYEIAHRPGVLASELAAELGLDPGYLSRILTGFEGKRLVARTASSADARRQHLRLTSAGHRVFAPLERRAQQQVRSLLAGLDDSRREAVLAAMSAIRSAFAPADAVSAASGADAMTLRSHRPGDMGWVIERHGALYFQEYGWNEEFEALVAGIAAEFISELDRSRERCWIAEAHGRRLGCVFLVAGDAGSAKLRLLLVEPEARGLGLGGRLVSECVSFARTAGYDRIVLWTQANLSGARRLYQRAGFVRTGREPHRSFGHDLVGETWELGLRGDVPEPPRGASKR